MEKGKSLKKRKMREGPLKVFFIHFCGQTKRKVGSQMRGNEKSQKKKKNTIMSQGIKEIRVGLQPI